MKNAYSQRKIVIVIAFFTVGIVFLGRLFYIQVIDKTYRISAENNVLRYLVQYPARGLMYDRNGKIIVYNEAVYDLMVIPRQVKTIDTNEFCHLLNITHDEFEKKIKRARRYSSYKPSLFEKQITKETYGYLEEKLFRYSGFFVQPRTLRGYPYSNAAHTLGYVGEVGVRQLNRDNYYSSGDYYGVTGLEHTYEKELRGKKGVKIVKVDVYNRVQGSFENGHYDTTAVSGSDLHTTLDIDLQTYGEQLMQNKRGSLVAIEPATGEILAFISSPTYDPNLLVGRIRGKNYLQLSKDSLKPLLNRGMMGQYPPGSTFKPVNALIGLQEHAITPYTQFSCAGTQARPIRCSHNHESPLRLNQAIEQSCNPYFWNLFNTLFSQHKNASQAYDLWFNHVRSMGMGEKFNTDLGYELSGNIPSHRIYDKIYKGKWNALTIRSLSIGQGEILVTPIQLANTTAIIANRGYYIPPHFVTQIGDSIHRYIQVNSTILPQHFEPVVDGMARVFDSDHGTGRYYRLDSISMCGKTGTAENPHGEDHSIFIAFAPRNNPKIAICAIIENGGFGSRWAVPITSLMIEKYINGTVKRTTLQERMFNGNLIKP